MSQTELQIFRRIVLRNGLVAEAELDSLLAQYARPERVVEHLIGSEALSPKKGKQLLSLYHEKLGSQSSTSDVAVRDTKTPSGRDTATLSGRDTATRLLDDTSETLAVAAAAERSAAGSEAHAPQAPAVAPPTPARAERSEPARPKSMTGVTGAALIQGLLRQAREAGASDLHIKAEMAPVIRVVGRLEDMDMPPLPANVAEESLLSVLDETQREVFVATNDLDFSLDAGPELGRFRANYLRQHRGVDAVFRPIPNRVPTFQELQLPEQVQVFTKHRVGIVLVTGPKGCGKTTTLAAMIDLINSTRREHIITVEDPIEFIHPCKLGHVNQRQVGPHTKSFSNALRSALREAPDVIMVGEMRDLETTSLAVTAAETGHLVLATLHTPDALRTIGRVLDVFPAKEQPQIRAMISESLRGIVSQSLIPNRDGKSMELALEILVNTPAIGHLIREERVFQVPGLMQTGRKLGMQLMDDSLVALVKSGRIAREEALARAQEHAQMEKQLEGH